MVYKSKLLNFETYGTLRINLHEDNTYFYLENGGYHWEVR